MGPRMTASYSSTYLNWKESARVTAKAADGAGAVSAQVGDVEHDKLRGVRVRQEREREQKVVTHPHWMHASLLRLKSYFIC